MLQGAGPLAKPPFSAPVDACSLEQQQQHDQQLGRSAQGHPPLQEKYSKSPAEVTIREARGPCDIRFRQDDNNNGQSTSSSSGIWSATVKSGSQEYGEGGTISTDKSKSREQQHGTQVQPLDKTQLLQPELQQGLQQVLPDEQHKALKRGLQRRVEQQQEEIFSNFVPWPGRPNSYRRPAEAAAAAVNSTTTPSSPAPAGTLKREFELLQQGIVAAAAASSSSSNGGRSRNTSSVGRAVRRQASKLKRLTANFLSRSLSSAAGSAMAGGPLPGGPPPLDSRVFVGEDALLAELPLEVEESLLEPALSWSCTEHSIARRRSGELGLLTLLNHSTPLKLVLPLETDGSSTVPPSNGAVSATMPPATAAAAAAATVASPGPCPYVLPFEDIMQLLGPLMPRPASIDASAARGNLESADARGNPDGAKGASAADDGMGAAAAADIGGATPFTPQATTAASADQGDGEPNLDADGAGAAAAAADGRVIAAADTPCDDASGANSITAAAAAVSAVTQEAEREYHVTAAKAVQAKEAEGTAWADSPAAALTAAHALAANPDTELVASAATEAGKATEAEESAGTAAAEAAASAAAEQLESTTAEAEGAETVTEPTSADAGAAAEAVRQVKKTAEAAIDRTGLTAVIMETVEVSAAPEASAATATAETALDGLEERCTASGESSPDGASGKAHKMTGKITEAAASEAAASEAAAWEAEESEAATSEAAAASAIARPETASGGVTPELLQTAIDDEEMPGALRAPFTELRDRGSASGVASAVLEEATDAGEAAAAASACIPTDEDQSSSRLTTSSQQLTSRGGEEDAETLEARQLRLGLSDFPEWLMQVDADADEQKPNPYKAVRLRKTGLLPGREDGRNDEATARRIRARLDWMKGCAAKGKQQGRNASTAYRGVEGRGAAAPADAAVASPDAISQSSSRSTSTAPDGAWKRREVQHQQHERRTLGLIRRDLGSSTLQHPVEADDLGPGALASSEAKGHSVAALRALFERSRAAWFEGELQRFSQTSDSGDPTKARRSR